MTKNMIWLKTLVTAVFCGLNLMPAAAQNQDDEELILVYYDKGRLDVFPKNIVTSMENARKQLYITTVSDTTFYYNESRIDSVVERTRGEISGRLASITQLKLNNKYNDQVYTDIIADIIGDSIITAEIGAIGKWLTPSIQLSDESARVYIGHERQESKVSRRSYANDVYYTVALPDQRIFNHALVKEAVWGDGGNSPYIETPLALTASMFSTNLPGQGNEGFQQMLDGNYATCFHSTWNVSAEEKETIYQTHPYIDIALPEQLRTFRFGYTTRNTGTYWPLSLTLSASNDGTNWTEIKTFTAAADQLPTSAGANFLSNVIDLRRNYRYLRLFLNESGYRLYLVFAEFQLVKVEENPNASEDPVEPAEYRYQMDPFGRRYRVHFDWLTDRATNVPSVNINVENGYMVTSKENYFNATITINGGGVFPSMETTNMQIRGRGNSSWQSYGSYYGYYYYDYGYAYKNPYRIKFPEKHKPLGLTNGKNWVLLANKQTGSMLANAIGMKAACLVGTEGANHIVPVELYMNGYYYGNYNFTEKVGLSNNSIDLDDESRATLLELDTYYDETYKFRSDYYNLPVNIKDPDFDEDNSSLLTQEMIQREFNYLMQVLKNGRDLSDIVDIQTLAKYLMVNELVANNEVKHPKSTFLYNPDVMGLNSKFYFGPVWDLDWAFGYETNHAYFTAEETSDFYNDYRSFSGKQFIYDLRLVSKDLDKAYYKVWKHFIDFQLEELIDFCDDYYAYARPSLEHNADKWNDGRSYESSKENAKKWLRGRAMSVFRKLTPYDLPDEGPIIDSFDFSGDVSGIAIEDHTESLDEGCLVDVYDLNGRCVKKRVSVFDLRTGLKPGIYIVNGKKMVIK